LVTDGPAQFDDSDRTVLAAAGVRVREERVRRLVGYEGRLDRVEFASGPAEQRDALFVRTQREQPNGLAAALGCELTAGGTIVIDGDGAPPRPASTRPATRRQSACARWRVRSGPARAPVWRSRSTTCPSRRRPELALGPLAHDYRQPAAW
jgi:hypothetical protein